MRISYNFAVGPSASMDVRKKLQIHNALIKECQLSGPSSRISAKMRKTLEDLSKEQRRQVADESHEGCTALFLASKNGAAEIVGFLVRVCHADIEKKGRYEVLEEGVSHHVTPLWCAAVAGRLAVVKVLIGHGADVNTASDSGWRSR